MRWKAVVCVVSLAPLTGCNIAYYASHNLVNEPASRWDEHKLDKRLNAEARAAWREVCRQYPARTFTPEFADGFQEGYADLLDNGGIPRPPVVPPPRYRRARYLTPEGNARARDYLIGFKYGADVASATGRREFLTVHLPAPPDTSLELPSVPVPDPGPSPTPPTPVLPVPPKPVDGKTPEPTSARPDPRPLATVPVPSVPIAVMLEPSVELPEVLPPVSAPPAPLPPIRQAPAPVPPAADPR
jgi:hypothetical protein